MVPDRASLVRDDGNLLPHHAGREPGFPPWRLDVFLQEAMRFAPGIAGPRIGPGAAFVVGGAGRLAFVVAFAPALHIEILVVAAKAVDRGFDRGVARLDHAGAAHAGDATIVLRPR